MNSDVADTDGVEVQIKINKYMANKAKKRAGLFTTTIVWSSCIMSFVSIYTETSIIRSVDSAI